MTRSTLGTLAAALVVADASLDVANDVVDWKLGITYGFSNGFTAAVSYIDTNRNLPGATGHKISNGTGVLSISKTF